MMTTPAVEKLVEPEKLEIAFLTEYLNGCQWHPAFLMLAVMLRITKNKRLGPNLTWQPRTLNQLIRNMRTWLPNAHFWPQIVKLFPGIKPFDLLIRVQISFWAAVFGITVKDLCARLNDDNDSLSQLRLAFGLKDACHPQRISELHSRLGTKQEKIKLYLAIRAELVHRLALDHLSEADVQEATQQNTFDRPLLTVGGHYGFDLFLNYLFWQGIFAYLSLTLLKECTPNGYQLRDLLIAYCQRLDEEVHNCDDLAVHVRNQLWANEENRQVIAPSSQTLANFLHKLSTGRLILIQDHLINRAHKNKKNLVVAIDACILEVFGKKYEGAMYLWDHVENRKVFGYKLHVIYCVTTQLPIAFYLHQPGDTDAQALDLLVKQARLVLGVKQLGLLLFDKGYWNLDEYESLINDQRENILTPAKKYADVKNAISDIPADRWQPGMLPNERWAETFVTFGKNGLKLRLVVRKFPTWRNKRLNGKVIKDENNQPVKEQVILYHSYLTNLSEIEIETDQIVCTYATRWGIEDFFAEMLHQYNLRQFPGTSLSLVKRHLVLTFMLYTLIEGFKGYAADWLNQTRYATMELHRFGKEFLRAPLDFLRWLRDNKPRSGAIRSPRSNAGIIGHFLEDLIPP